MNSSQGRGSSSLSLWRYGDLADLDGLQMRGFGGFDIIDVVTYRIADYN